MLRFCTALFFGVLTAHASAHVRIAAAANLAQVIEPLTAAFRSHHPEVKIDIVLGSSGNLLAQIHSGAPYDVFLSADMAYPRALIAQNRVQADSLFPFATGRLVLWTTRADLKLTDLATALQNPSVQKIAIANPDIAPYGRAARLAINKLDLWPAVESKIVIGENVSQTAQFVASGNADLGFVALSLVISPGLKARGSWLEVPADMHSSLDQGAVLTNQGAQNLDAREFLAFIQSPEARKIFARYGYRVPALP